MSSTPRFMQATANARARERESQNRALEPAQNQPFMNFAHGQGEPFVFRSSPKDITQPVRKPAKKDAQAKPRVHHKPAERTVSRAAESPATKHVAGCNDGKRRRCVRPSPLRATLNDSMMDDEGDVTTVATCDQQFDEIVALRERLFELEKQNEPMQALAERLRAESTDLQLRIRSEELRVPSFADLPARLVTNAHDENFQPGGSFDMDREDADAEDDHRLSLPDSFDGGADDAPEAQWTPRAIAGPGGGFHFI